jgi:hypothetical protein
MPRRSASASRPATSTSGVSTAMSPGVEARRRPGTAASAARTAAAVTAATSRSKVARPSAMRPTRWVAGPPAVLAPAPRLPGSNIRASLRIDSQCRASAPRPPAGPRARPSHPSATTRSAAAAFACSTARTTGSGVERARPRTRRATRRLRRASRARRRQRRHGDGRRCRRRRAMRPRRAPSVTATMPPPASSESASSAAWNDVADGAAVHRREQIVERITRGDDVGSQHVRDLASGRASCTHRCGRGRARQGPLSPCGGSERECGGSGPADVRRALRRRRSALAIMAAASVGSSGFAQCARSRSRWCARRRA